jgi:hypothetical protein
MGILRLRRYYGTCSSVSVPAPFRFADREPNSNWIGQCHGFSEPVVDDTKSF